MSGILRVVFLMPLIVWLSTIAQAAAVPDLYQARTIVTGDREETRIPGIAECFKDVLVKVSGDPRLIGDPRVTALSEQASSYVRTYRARDRLEGIPIHDEQGSRDRPYDLIVDFESHKIDAALNTLGRKPWGSERPRVAMLISVRLETNAYMLATDGAFGRDQRESLAAASWQMGLPVALPSEAALAARGLSIAAPLDFERLKALANAIGGDLPLAGSLSWEKGRGGWVADWRLYVSGSVYRWRISDVNFDDAFRSAMRGAAQILSGNGDPQ
jgi:hypothetical protein